MYDDLREGFTEYLRYERKLSENTIAAYERDVDQYLRWLDEEGIALPGSRPRWWRAPGCSV